MNATHYIGALLVEAAPGRRPRVHVRVWFPHLTEADAKARGFQRSADMGPTGETAAAYAKALAELVRNATRGAAAVRALNSSSGGSSGSNSSNSSSNSSSSGGNGTKTAAPSNQQQQQQKQQQQKQQQQKQQKQQQQGKAAASNSSSSSSSRSSSDAADDCAPVVTSGAFTMDVLTCLDHVALVLRWLARQPPVYWVAPKMKYTWDNLAASAVTQGAPLAARMQRAGDAAANGLHPVWAAGLRGEGQVVGVGDSGVDVGSCYFYDPKVDFMAGIKRTPRGTAVFESDAHRKIALYVGLADTSDAVGHGTHTAGTIAGSRFDADEPDGATGMAPAARLAILDLARGSNGFVVAPDDLSDGYFSPSYDAGARVHSDSWGSDVIVYDYSAASLDRWLWEHPDFVSVFAAGNYGSEDGYRSTVTSPATSKNAIAVGATLAVGMPNAGEQTQAAVHSLSVAVALDGRGAQTIGGRAVQAAFGAAVPRGRALPLVAAAPEDACSDVARVPPGSLLLVRRGGCYFSAKLENAAAAGAAGVLLTNDKQEGYFQMEASEGGGALERAGIFMAGVPLSTGRRLWGLAGNGSVAGASLVATFGAPARGLPAYEHIASFSSYGPTQDGRIKPDVVAPGLLLSAKSGGGGGAPGAQPQCATQRSQGTSMACPVVAGSAALVRQYFADGFYPTGQKNAAHAFKPSGPLIKAALLGGASNMLGNSEAGLPLEPAPSFKQGFGRVNLTRAIPLASSGWRLQVVDLAPLGPGETHKYCITALGGPLAVTLAWYDYPGSPAAGGSMLVNNLDLGACLRTLFALSRVGWSALLF